MSTAYKNAIMNLKPKMFITFDGDSFDPFSGLLTSPPDIIDESGNGNIGHMQGDPTLGYTMGQTSLVELEIGGVYSTLFNPAGFYSTSNPFPKSYVEVQHSVDFNFPNYGSFSIALFVEKTTNEAVFRSHPEVGWPFSGSNSGPLFRPIISKGPAVTIGFIDGSIYSDDESLRLIDPNGSTYDVNLTSSFQPFHNDQKHIVYSWDVQQTSLSIYVATSTLYINGIIGHQHVYNYTYSVPNTSTPASWFIAGAPTSPIGDPNYNFGDRCTCPTYFDQIAVFDFGLSATQVAGLFKKTRSYDRMILARLPYMYFPFEDGEVVGNYAVSNQGFGITGNGQLFGGSGLIHRRFGGPKIPVSYATSFGGGGMGEMARQFTYPYDVPIFSGDFTVETWFNIFSGDRGIIFSAPQNDQFPFDGPIVQMNWANDQLTPGAMQFNVRQDVSISTLPGYTFNDGLWHHLAAIRRGTILELWIDGVLHVQSGSVGVTSTANTGFARSFYVMGMLPEKLFLSGLLSKFAVYYFALQPYEIVMRKTYATAYRLFGGITLQTNPVQADIRVYRHVDGTLVTKAQSDPITGKFEIDVPNFDKYDLMVLEGNDPTVRYRAYGPVIPAEYADTAL